MKFRNLVSLLLIGLLASAAAAAPEPNVKIAAANPSRIIVEMQEAKELMDGLALKEKDLEAKAQQEKMKVDAAHRELQQSGLRPGSPQYLELADKADAADAEMQTFVA